MTAEDILERRTKHGLHLTAAREGRVRGLARAAAPPVQPALRRTA